MNLVLLLLEFTSIVLLKQRALFEFLNTEDNKPFTNVFSPFAVTTPSPSVIFDLVLKVKHSNKDKTSVSANSDVIRGGDVSKGFIESG